MSRARRLARLKRGFIFVATNYTGAFIIVLAISILTCLFTINYLTLLENDLTAVYENEVKGQDYIQVAFTNLLTIENAVQEILINADPATTGNAISTINQSLAELKKSVDSATPRFYTPAGKEILAQSRKDMNSFIAFLVPLTSQLRDNPSLDSELLAQLKARKNRVQADFKRLIANKTANSSHDFHSIIAQLRLSLVCTVIIVIGSIAIRISMYLAQRHQAAKARQAAARARDPGEAPPPPPDSPAACP